MSEESAPRVEAIWLKPERRASMEPVERATLLEGIGLVGNVERGGYRQVTLLDADAWERATSDVGASVEPIVRRANVLVRGMDFNESTDRVVRIGESRVQIRGETLPCQQMEAAAPGLREALAVEWRGGAYGMVMRGGEIAVGDEVSWE